MSKEGITEYYLLISCPGDVDKFVDDIEDCVDDFNSVNGELYNAIISTRYWKDDSYAQSGGKPQDLLNDQFIKNCDAVVAIFWTRFGTPTDKYGSGTEEEIEMMLASGKQVFMYFLNKKKRPTDTDPEQYKKVQDFYQKYQDKGICYTFKNKKDLMRKFTYDLGAYFLPIFKKGSEEDSKRQGSCIGIEDNNLGSNEYFTVTHQDLIEYDLMRNLRKDIISRLNKLNTSFLPQRDIKDGTNKTTQSMNLDDPGINKQVNKLKNEGYSISAVSSDINIDNTQEEVITHFANDEGITIEDQFWNLGNLKWRQTEFSESEDGNDKTLNGTDEEKERYNSIKELFTLINKYNEYYDYFSNLDALILTNLIVSNTGDSPDEDIEIKLKFKKGCLISLEDFPVPGIDIIKDIINNNFLDAIYENESEDCVEKYSGYLTQLPNFELYLKLGKQQLSIQEEYEKDKEYYKAKVKQIFCYKYNDKEDADILVFNIKSLKQSTKMAFPSLLVFKEVPKYIDYEIKSKCRTGVVKGTLNFQLNNEERQ